MTNDAGFALAYAVIMLNTDQHNHNVRKQNIPMTVEVRHTHSHSLDSPCQLMDTGPLTEEQCAESQYWGGNGPRPSGPTMSIFFLSRGGAVVCV